MSEADIRSVIYTIVNGVTDAGKVYDRERWSASWDDFLSQFKTSISGTSQIRGWHIAYGGFSTAPAKDFVQPPGANSSVIQRNHQFFIRGFMGLDDSESTEKIFAALAESVVNALDGDATLHHAGYLDAQPANIGTFGTLVLAGAFCHYAEITQVVGEAVEI